MDAPSSRRDDGLSLRLYRLLLLAYPRAFREEYASEMLLVFRDSYCEAAQRLGTPGVLLLWRDFCYDLIKTVCIEHARSWMQRVERAFGLDRRDQLAPMLQFTLHVAQHTDIGRVRANNEDNLISFVPLDRHLLRAKGALFVVSDGMGGHHLGHVASELAVQEVKEHYGQNLYDDIPTALQKAIQQANSTIYQLVGEVPQGANKITIGATCVAAVLHNRTLYAANVGDSRVYVLHEGQLHQVTRDHSLVAQLVERGEITSVEARTHEQRHQIYRSLGSPAVEVDLFSEPVQEGDTVILCTDGLCGVLEDEDLRAIVERYDPEESVQRLIACANEKGGPDNVTAIVVHVSAA